MTIEKSTKTIIAPLRRNVARRSADTFRHFACNNSVQSNDPEAATQCLLFADVQILLWHLACSNSVQSSEAEPLTQFMLQGDEGITFLNFTCSNSVHTNEAEPITLCPLRGADRIILRHFACSNSVFNQGGSPGMQATPTQVYYAGLLAIACYSPCMGASTPLKYKRTCGRTDMYIHAEHVAPSMPHICA